MNQDKKSEIDLFDNISECHQEIDLDAPKFAYALMRILSYWPNLMYGRVLECGCGRGAIGKSIAQKFDVEIIGVDLSPKSIAANQNSKNYQAIVGDLEDQSLFQPKSFDVVLCVNILHHFPDLTIVMQNLSYWLKDGGKIVIVEPNGNNPVMRLSFILRRCLEFVVGKDFIVRHKIATPNEVHHTFAYYCGVMSHNKLLPFLSGSFFFHARSQGIFVIKSFLINVFYFFFRRCFFGGSNMFIFAVKHE